jgi:hypothetical protein
MKRFLLIALGLVLALVLTLPLQTTSALATDFPQTGHSLNGSFLQFWSAQGGIARFGYPITEQISEGGRTVQYFERAVFELWPQNPEPYQVQLRLTGRVLTLGRGSEGPFQRLAGFESTVDHTYFSETGHSLSYGFRSYWLANGGLEIFGYPISEEFEETSATDGQTYTVQYFERARFEYHPESVGTGAEVQLGLLGRQCYELRAAAIATMQQYVSPSAPYRIGYPQGWLAEEDVDEVSFSPSSSADFGMLVSTMEAPPSVTKESLSEMLNSDLGDISSDVGVQSTQPLVLAGEEWVESNGYLEVEGIRASFTALITVRAGTAYFVLFAAPGDLFEAARQVYFLPMLDTLSFSPGTA